MKRRVMQLLFTLGLLLTLAISTMWVRAGWVTDTFTARRWQLEGELRTVRHVEIEFFLSCFVLSWGWDEDLGHSSVPGPHEPARWLIEHHVRDARPFRLRPRGWWERMGFVRYSEALFVGSAIGVPPWFAVLVSAAATVPPLLWLRRDHRRRFRSTRGLCPTCGYDLRGAEHERCPECGTAVPAAAPRAV